MEDLERGTGGMVYKELMMKNHRFQTAVRETSDADTKNLCSIKILVQRRKLNKLDSVGSSYN